MENFCDAFEYDFKLRLFADEHELESFDYDCNSFLQDCLTYCPTPLDYPSPAKISRK